MILRVCSRFAAWRCTPKTYQKKKKIPCPLDLCVVVLPRSFVCSIGTRAQARQKSSTATRLRDRVKLSRARAAQGRASPRARSGRGAAAPSTRRNARRRVSRGTSGGTACRRARSCLEPRARARARAERVVMRSVSRHADSLADASILGRLFALRWLYAAPPRDILLRLYCAGLACVYY